MKGFTLIELIIVMTISSLLATMGLVAYRKYNETQTLTSAVSDVASMLYAARSRAQSQLKPIGISVCDPNPNPQPLYGYRVTLCRGGCAANSLHTYDLTIVCSGGEGTSQKFQDKKMLEDLTFLDGSQQTFTFQVITGEVSEITVPPYKTIQINYQGASKTIKIYKNGSIEIN